MANERLFKAMGKMTAEMGLMRSIVSRTIATRISFSATIVNAFLTTGSGKNTVCTQCICMHM